MIKHEVWTLLRGVSDAAELDRNPGCNSQFHVRLYFPYTPSVFLCSKIIFVACHILSCC